MSILDIARNHLSLFELTWQNDQELVIIHDLLEQYDHFQIALDREKRLAEARGISWAERATAEQCALIAHNWRDGKTGISCCHRLDIESEIKGKFGIVE